MKTLRFLLAKEFRQIFRNSTILKMIIVFPIAQLILLPLAADYEIKNINVVVVDNDLSPISSDIVSKIQASPYFSIVGQESTYEQAFGWLERDKADIVLEFPKNFSSHLIQRGSDEIFLGLNAINGTKAAVGGNYLGHILQDYNSELRRDIMPTINYTLPQISITYNNLFNKKLDYPTFMIPGILAILVTMVGAYMCALNIVVEKEVGTIEQINVTPIKKHLFILGKLIPFWFIGLFVFTLALFGVGYLLYGITPTGSYTVVYAYLAIYLVAVLGIGLLISTYSNNQQQAMSLAFFFMMIFILMSGLFTSVESMPTWAKWFAYLNPATYFIEVMRMVILKGSSFTHLVNHFLIMTGFAVFFNGWAILNYRKQS